MISVRRFPDVASFLAIGGEFLADREAEHNLILGLCSRSIAYPQTYAEPPYLAIAMEGERVGAIGFRTPPHNLVLSEVDAPAAIEAIARDARDAFASLPGVLGPKEGARAFTETWRELTGFGADRVMTNRIYRASGRTVHEPPAVALARPIDDPDGDLLLWEDAGAPVSLAGFGDPTPNGTRVGPVYTPPALRGRGYASVVDEYAFA